MAKKKTQPKKREVPPEEALYQVRKEMSVLRDLEKKLAHEVMDEFTMSGKRRGTHFSIAQKQTLKVVEPELAFQWAAERNCIAVDTSKAMKILRREFEIPECFEIRKTDYLRIGGEHSDEINPGDDS